jgi:hypothetical protein
MIYTQNKSILAYKATKTSYRVGRSAFCHKMKSEPHKTKKTKQKQNCEADLSQRVLVQSSLVFKNVSSFFYKLLYLCLPTAEGLDPLDEISVHLLLAHDHYNADNNRRHSICIRTITCTTCKQLHHNAFMRHIITFFIIQGQQCLSGN